MRIIAGTARGRRLVAPRGLATRPTSDRVREAVFDMLTSLGGLEDAEVADLYAGSGAMGLEALSRGAASATFVERDRAAAAVIERNLASTGLGPGRVVCTDVMAFLRSGGGPYDLVFCDPPYDFDAWGELLAGVRGRLVVAESDRSVAADSGRPVIRSRRYGGTVVEVLGEIPG